MIDGKAPERLDAVAARRTAAAGLHRERETALAQAAASWAKLRGRSVETTSARP